MSEKMRWLYIGNKVVDGNVLEVYRCSKCCCLINVVRGTVRPNECPNCGTGVFIHEARTKVDWIPVSVAKPPKSGTYLCYRAKTDSVLYLTYSAKHDAFNCYDSEESPQHIMSVDYWAPEVEKPRKRMEEV